MFSLTIAFGPGPVVWTLLFKEKETAVKSLNRIGEAIGNFVEMTDDFSQTAAFTKTEIHGFMLEDLEQSRLAHIERALHQARTQAKGQEIASADPVLQAAASRQHKSPILQPAFPGMPAVNGRFPS